MNERGDRHMNACVDDRSRHDDVIAKVGSWRSYRSPMLRWLGIAGGYGRRWYHDSDQGRIVNKVFDSMVKLEMSTWHFKFWEAGGRVARFVVPPLGGWHDARDNRLKAGLRTSFTGYTITLVSAMNSGSWRSGLKSASSAIMSRKLVSSSNVRERYRSAKVRLRARLQ